MASTYAYGGEFSSDEETDKHEQAPSAGNKFASDGALKKASKEQIQAAIESIARSEGANVELPDDVLAGLLDHYKVPHGPIVGSTRLLYKRIVTREVNKMVANQNEAASKQSELSDKKGKSVGAKNRFVAPDSFSGDDDEDVEDGVLVSPNLYYEHRVTCSDPLLVPMEIDSEDVNNLSKKSNKKGSKSRESSDESGSDDDESGDSEVVDVTPIKQAPSSTHRSAANKPTEKAGSIEKKVPKNTRLSRTASAKKAQSTGDEEVISVSTKVEEPNSVTCPQQKKLSKFVLLVGLLLILAICFVAYKFGSQVTFGTTLSRSINF